MLSVRIIVYILIIGIIIFIPFKLQTQDSKKLLYIRSDSVKVKLITPQKSKPKVKPRSKPRPKIKKISEPVTKVIQKKKKKNIVVPVIKNDPVQQNTNIVYTPVVALPKVRPQEIVVDTTIQESYYTKLYERINKTKRYPKKAIKFKQEAEIKVYFRVLEDGEIVDLKILGPSSFRVLDKEVKRMFKKIKRFAKPPQELQLPLEVKITISFRLR